MFPPRPSTPHRNKFLASALIILGALVVILVIRTSTPAMPSWQGKTIDQWLDIQLKASNPYSTDPHKEQTAEMAETAIRSIGTNALPFVLADIRARESAVNRLESHLADRAPFLKLHPFHARDRWGRAINLLRILGPIANPCAPTLAQNVFRGDASPFAESALMAIGPAAIPWFTNLVQNPDCPHRDRLVYAFFLGIYEKEITPAEAAQQMPLLYDLFRSTNADVRAAAARAIGFIRDDPTQSSQVLAGGLSDPSAMVRGECMVALSDFGVVLINAPRSVAQKVADAFDRGNVATRLFACGALANMPYHTDISIPLLRRAAADSELRVRIAASNALVQLGDHSADFLKAK